MIKFNEQSKKRIFFRRNGLSSGTSSYRNNYNSWKERGRTLDQYSSDKLDRTTGKSVNGLTNSLDHPASHHLTSSSGSLPLSSSHHSLGGGSGGSSGPHGGSSHLNSLSSGVNSAGGSSSIQARSRTTKSNNNKKRHKSRSSDSCSNSSESRSGASRSSSASSSSRSSSSDSNTSKSRSPESRTASGGSGSTSVWAKIQSSLGNYLPHTEFDKQCTIIVGNLPHRAEGWLHFSSCTDIKRGVGFW